MRRVPGEGASCPKQASSTLCVAAGQTLQVAERERTSESFLEPFCRAGPHGGPTSAPTGLFPPGATLPLLQPGGHSPANSARTFSAFPHALMAPQSSPLEMTPSRVHSFPVTCADESHFGNRALLSESKGPVQATRKLPPHTQLEASALCSAQASRTPVFHPLPLLLLHPPELEEHNSLATEVLFVAGV